MDPLRSSCAEVLLTCNSVASTTSNGIKRIKNISPVWFLRAGLGLVYVYSSYHIFANPSAWGGFLPAFLSDFIARMMPLEVYMRIQGGGELLMGLLFLIWFTSRLLVFAVAAFASLEIAGILLLMGFDDITFRDIGLPGTSLALLFLSLKRK